MPPKSPLKVEYRLGTSGLVQTGKDAPSEEAFWSYTKFVQEGKLPDTLAARWIEGKFSGLVALSTIRIPKEA